MKEINENFKDELDNSLGVFLRSIVGLKQDVMQKEFSKLIGITGI